MTHTIHELRQKQSMPLPAKIIMTENRIRQWYDHWNGNVVINFSGGKDSTVLLHIARRMYPNIKAVFVDTGLEYPEVRELVHTWDNVDIIRPKKTFRQVLDEYGYPVVSKEVAECVEGYRRYIDSGGTKYTYRAQRLDGAARDKQGNLSKYNHAKWKYLVDAPFKVSNKCCQVIKKAPMQGYTRKTGLFPITAQMACESMLRTNVWMRQGCNAYEAKHPISNPMSFWTEQDVLRYIVQNNIKIASVYGTIEQTAASLMPEVPPVYRCTGVDRTGCMFCMFGVHLEAHPNRFERMRQTHPKIYDYCMNTLGIKQVLDYIGVSVQEGGD